MKKATTKRLFCSTGTATVERGWYDVTLRKSTEHPYKWTPNKIKNTSSLSQATYGQVININGNKVSLPINHFSEKELW